MKTYVQPAEVLHWTAPVGGVVSGGLYKIGDVLIVATVDAPAGEKFSAYVGRGACTVKKAAASAWTEGQKLYWDPGAKNVTPVAAGGVLVGFAAYPAASADLEGVAVLDGVVR